MFIDICEIKGKYRGPDRDVNLSLFCLTENYKLDYELYCNFCNYNLEYNGDSKYLFRTSNPKKFKLLSCSIGLLLQLFQYIISIDFKSNNTGIVFN